MCNCPDNSSNQFACAYVTSINEAPQGRTNKFELAVTLVRGRFSLGPAVLHLADGGEEVVTLLGAWHSTNSKHEILTWYGVESYGSFDWRQSQCLTQEPGEKL